MKMPPHLAQVLNTLAHEIRTPLSVSQGYLKLYLDGRLTNADDTRRAFEQTREALGALAALCVDMGKVSALAESASTGIPDRLSTADLIRSLRTQGAVKDASWTGEGGARTVDTTNHRDLVQALAIVSKAAFDEARDDPHAIRADEGDDLIVLAGTAASLPALQSGPQAPEARPVDFGRGGKGLKLIWAAFVLDKHRIQTWSHADHRAAVGFRIPLVSA
jgi:signal transduction histidine kinase